MSYAAIFDEVDPGANQPCVGGGNTYWFNVASGKVWRSNLSTNRYVDTGKSILPSTVIGSAVPAIPVQMSQMSSPVKATIDAITLAGGPSWLASLSPTYRSANVANVTVSNVEKSVVSLEIPANTLRAGTTFHFRAFGNFGMLLNLTSTSRGAVRCGPIGLAGPLAASVTVNNAKGLSGTAPFMIEGECTVKSIGVAGSISGRLCMWGAIVAPFNDDISLPLSTAVNTAINNVLELTYVTNNVAASASFDLGIIEGG